MTADLLNPAPGGAAGEFAAALAAVQAELPAVTKNRTADVGTYKYAYADLADVSAAIMPILGKHGLAFTALPGHQPNGKFGLRYYLLHKSGARLEGFYEIPEQGGIQQVGGRITYARRYVLCAVTGVAADEDTDAREDDRTRPARTPSASPAETAPPRPDAPQGPRQRQRPGQRSAGEAQNAAPAAADSAAPADPAAGAAPDNRNIIGPIVKQFDRLGITDRNDRLILTAKILRLDNIPESSAKLTPEQRTRLHYFLEHARDIETLNHRINAGEAHDAS